MPSRRPAKKRAPKPLMLLGIGFDADDGHKRVTQGRDFFLVGGSAETHGELQERAVKLNEELDRRGKRLRDVGSRDEMRDIVERAWK